MIPTPRALTLGEDIGSRRRDLVELRAHALRGVEPVAVTGNAERAYQTLVRQIATS